MQVVPSATNEGGVETSDYEFNADKFVFKVRKNLLYSSDDVWVRAGVDGLCRIGVTDFAQRRGGDIVFAEIQPAGTEVARGGLVGSYETVKLVRDILSPISGSILKVNPLLESKPEVINSDPYGDGWIAELKSETKLEGLLSSEQYFEQMKLRVGEELKKIKGL